MQPSTPDAVQVLRELIPDDARPTDRVFKGLIPRMPRFRADLEAAGIPYIDAKGEYADFHSLRKTFGTMLTLAGVGQRTVMELMRHSDMRLTAKTYTDANMLPVSDAVALLSAFSAKQEDPQIDPQKLASESRAVSASVAVNGIEPIVLTAGDQTFSPSETASVPNSPEMAKNARCRVRTCDLSPRGPLGEVKKREPAGTCNFQFLISNSKSQRAISSVVEHLLHTQGVAGSIPASRTVDFPKAEKTARRFKTKVTTIIWRFIPQRFTNLDAAREGF
jgi:hypothetical protein